MHTHLQCTRVDSPEQLYQAPSPQSLVCAANAEYHLCRALLTKLHRYNWHRRLPCKGTCERNLRGRFVQAAKWTNQLVSSEPPEAQEMACSTFAYRARFALAPPSCDMPCVTSQETLMAHTHLYRRDLGLRAIVWMFCVQIFSALQCEDCWSFLYIAELRPVMGMFRLSAQ